MWGREGEREGWEVRVTEGEGVRLREGGRVVRKERGRYKARGRGGDSEEVGREVAKNREGRESGWRRGVERGTVRKGRGIKEEGMVW